VNPVAGDSVALSLVLGQSPNSCTPSFDNESLQVEVSPLAIYPPRITLYLTYTTTPSQGDACLMVPTEYGPEFVLPDAAVGNYTVVDATTDSVVGRFNVAAGRQVSGTVTDDPGLARRPPRPLDSVRVTIAPDLPSWVGEEPYSETITTDSQGEFVLHMVPDGNYIISFSRRGYALQEHRIEIAADTVLTVRMIPGGQKGTVQGTVRFVPRTPTPRPPIETQPLASCTLLVSPEWHMNDVADVPVFVAVTDSTGAFSIEDIPMIYSGQPISVTARKHGFESQTVDTSMRYMEITELNFMLVPEQLPVTRSGSSHAASARMHISYSGSRRALIVEVDENSEIRIAAFDMNGRCVEGLSGTLRLAAGTHAIPIANGVGPGVYVMRVDGPRVSSSVRMEICK